MNEWKGTQLIAEKSHSNSRSVNHRYGPGTALVGKIVIGLFAVSGLKYA